MRHTYTEGDLTTIAKCLIRCTRRKDAFLEASYDLNLSAKAVESYYYGHKLEIEGIMAELLYDKVDETYEKAYTPWYKRLWNSIITIFKKNKVTL